MFFVEILVFFNLVSLYICHIDMIKLYSALENLSFKIQGRRAEGEAGGWSTGTQAA